MPLIPKRVRDLSFWHYQIAGWLSMAVLRVLVNVASLGYWEGKLVLRVLLEVFLGFLLTSVLRCVYRRTRARNMSVLSLTTLITVSSLIVAVVAVGCSIALAQFSGGLKMMTDVSLLLWLLSSVAYTFPDKLAWSGLYFGITFWRSWEDERERAEQAAEEAQRAQLQKLRYRLNPRFLFDALTSARALVDEDAKGARQVVTELSEFLRYSLVSRDKPLVLLRDELEAVRLFLSIERRRYGAKLNVTVDVPDETRELPIPGFLIYPVVERALQYATPTHSGQLRLEIRAAVLADALELTVTHSGNELEGIGGHDLQAMNERLEEVLPGQCLTAREWKEGETSVKIRLPLIMGDELEREVASDYR